MRLLGLDIGDKTVGVAVSDPLGLTAQGVETIRFKQSTESFNKLAALIEEYKVEKIICGLPLNMNGSEGPQAAKVRLFVQSLTSYLQKRRSEIPVQFWDERLSTTAAERSLLEADLSRAKRKKVIDTMAAVFILQGYLDSLSGSS